MKETEHDYQNCIVGNFYDNKCTGHFSSWEIFKKNYLGFTSRGFDDTYHFVFRYDIHKQKDNNYYLELCVMLQRKGIYTHLNIYNIDQNTLDTEVKEWLQGRSKYIKSLWKEIGIETDEIVKFNHGLKLLVDENEIYIKRIEKLLSENLKLKEDVKFLKE